LPIPTLCGKIRKAYSNFKTFVPTLHGKITKQSKQFSKLNSKFTSFKRTSQEHVVKHDENATKFYYFILLKQ